MTCFAGRRRYLEILVKYVDKLIAKGLVDEFHIWDYTRDPEDFFWIRDNCQRFKVFQAQDKNTWKEYYMHYAHINYPDPDTVLIKCDDDIMFIDIDRFQSFIDLRRARLDDFIAFPSIVNNRIPGIFQYKLGQWPNVDFKDVNELYHSGETCSKLHNYFINNKDEFLKISRNLVNCTYSLEHNIEDYVNINFFAILAKDLHIFEYCWDVSDEYNLALHVPMCLKRSNYIDAGLVVCHMSFLNQRELGFDETEALKGYLELSVTTLDNIVDH